MISSRTLGLGGLFGEIFRLYRRHFGLLLALAMTPAVPNLLMQLGAGPSITSGNFVIALTRSAEPPVPPNLALFGLGFLGMFVLTPLAAALAPCAAIAIASGSSPTVGSVLWTVVRRYAALAILTLANMAAGALVIFCGLGIWLWVVWSLAIPVALAERVGAGRALRRSWDLTEGSGWRLLGIFILVYLLIYAADFALGGLASLVAVAISFVSLSTKVVFATVLQTVGAAIVSQSLGLLQVCLYFELRARKECSDSDTLARTA